MGEVVLRTPFFVAYTVVVYSVSGFNCPTVVCVWSPGTVTDLVLLLGSVITTSYPSTVSELGGQETVRDRSRTLLTVGLPTGFGPAAHEKKKKNEHQNK